MKPKNVYVRLRYAANRVREEGWAWTLRETGSRLLIWAFWLLLLPVSLLFHLAGWRRLPVITERIGHLAAEIDCFIKLSRLRPLPRRRYFVLAHPRRVSNPSLVDHWRTHVRFVDSPVWCELLTAMTRGVLMRHDVSRYVLAIGCSAQYFAVNAEWGDRPPILSVEPRQRQKVKASLRSLGLPDGAWFVCVHAREGGYSRGDERVHDYRNVHIETLIPAMQEIVRRGGWCVRMGDRTMHPLPSMQGVIDYAHHPQHSPALDILLCAACTFFLGNTSGLFAVSTAFGVPSALTNVTPMAAMGFAPRDLSIPKLLWSEREARLLHFVEVLSSDIGNYRMSRLYRDDGLRLIDNSPDEIVDLVVEMLDRLEGRTALYAELEPLQEHFRTLLAPNHYCYGAASRIGSRFLDRHRDLFGLTQKALATQQVL